MSRRKKSASLRSCSALRLMYLSRSLDCRRKFSSTRPNCCSWEATCGGNRPRRCKVSRSASVKAVPLLSAGSCKIAMPSGSAEGAFATTSSCVFCNIAHLLAALGRFAGRRARQLRAGFSVCFGHHLDRATRTFCLADSAALAVVVIELEALAWPQLDHRIVGAHAVAVIALE